MFTGTHERAIDDKGRVVVPSEFRSHLVDGAYVGRFERNLALWLPEQFDAKVADLKAQAERGELTRDQVRVWLGNSSAVKLDGQHRIFLSQSLRLGAGIGDQVVFLGSWSYVELWNEQRWREVAMQGDDEVLDANEAAFS